MIRIGDFQSDIGAVYWAGNRTGLDSHLIYIFQPMTDRSINLCLRKYTYADCIGPTCSEIEERIDHALRLSSCCRMLFCVSAFDALLCKYYTQLLSSEQERGTAVKSIIGKRLIRVVM